MDLEYTSSTLRNSDFKPLGNDHGLRIKAWR
jgi:hypothetical protein